MRPTEGKVLKDLDYMRLKDLYEFFNMDDKTTEMIIE